MKANLTITIDVEVLTKSKKKYDNLSGKIEELLRESLKTGEE